MHLIAFIIALILIAIGDWKTDPFPKPLRLWVGFVLLYGMDITLVLLQLWDISPPNLSQPLVWLIEPVARPVFEWLRGGTM